MDLEAFIDEYLDIWNRRDLTGLLAILAPGASYFDAFWRESCVGKDLSVYLNDSMADSVHLYRREGDITVHEDSVVYCYLAFCIDDDPQMERPLYNGAEALTIDDGLITTISNYYCDPRDEVIREIAKLARHRHGQNHYAVSGLGSLRFIRTRERLNAAMDQEKLFLMPNLSVKTIAETVECSVDQLEYLIDNEYGSDIQQFIMDHRLRYASEMLQELPGDAEAIAKVASFAGFSSTHEFVSAFQANFGMSPDEWSLKEKKPA